VKFFRLFILVTAILYISCKGNRHSTNQDAMAESSPVINTLADSQQVIITLPSPVEILEILATTKYTIDPDKVLKLYPAESFINTQSRAIALGMYSSDLAFLNLSNDKSQMENYLQTMLDLLNDLKIYGIIDNDLNQKIRQNLNIPDSLAYYSLIIYQDLMNQLESSNQKELLSLVLVGASTEAFYLAQSQLTDFHQTREFVDDIYNTREIFNQYYQYISMYKDRKLIVGPFSALSAIQSEFNQIEITPSEKKMVKKADGTFIIQGGYSINITEKEFNKLHNCIITSRNELIDKYLLLSE
jgi:hypothetical protein